LQSPTPTDTQGTRKTIVRDGVEYFPRQDITVMMVLGIDVEGPVESSGYYRNKGSADSVMLLIFDETDESCNVLYLNRDTMLTMDVLGVRGEYAGTFYGQLALAHTYGTGLEDSCVNMKNTLMNFLPGLSIDYYVAMNMDAIPILNDAVGGVTVNVTDDFSMVNPSITMGELTLHGDQVIDYVRTRKDVGDQKNVTRMARQREYVNGFLYALDTKEHEDIDFAVHIYEQLAPYIVTDCSVETLSKIINHYLEYELKDAITPEGDNLIEDGHYAFYADEEKLDALCVELFYRPKQ
jgi:LCP family protein required for cell wall assembly